MAAPLKDRSGKKVDPKKLVQDLAKPGSKGPRPWKYGTVATNLTPSKLSGILKEADEGDCTKLLILASEIERRDSHIGAQLRTRRLALAGLPWIVEAPTDDPADEEIANQLQAIVRRHTFSTLVFDLLDAIFKPWAVCETVWDKGEQWTPKRFIWRDPRSFTVSPEDGQTLLLKTEANPKGEELAPWKFITHAPRMFSGPLTTSGLVRPCSVMYSLKTLGLQAWVGYMELFGIPWRVGKYPNGASEEVQDSLVDAVQMLGMDGTAVMPEGMKLEVISAMGGGSGSQVHQQLADWCDRQMSKAILGQTLTADTGGGSYAQGSVHDGIRRTLLQADAVDLAATLQRDLIEPWIAINYGADVEPPTLRCQVEEPVDRKSFVDCLIPLVDRGLRVESSVIRDRMGIPAPAEGDAVEVLVPVSAQKTPVGAVQE